MIPDSERKAGADSGLFFGRWMTNEAAFGTGFAGGQTGEVVAAVAAVRSGRDDNRVRSKHESPRDDQGDSERPQYGAQHPLINKCDADRSEP